jgi:uncharacterized protein (UPF0128 family)
MLELSVSQAQREFTKLLDKSEVIVDRKSKVKKAVILPYEEYRRLIQGQKRREKKVGGGFERFVVALSRDFPTDDERYRAIVDT